MPVLYEQYDQLSPVRLKSDNAHLSILIRSIVLSLESDTVIDVADSELMKYSNFAVFFIIDEAIYKSYGPPDSDSRRSKI